VDHVPGLRAPVVTRGAAKSVTRGHPPRPISNPAASICGGPRSLSQHRHVPRAAPLPLQQQVLVERVAVNVAVRVAACTGVAIPVPRAPDAVPRLDDTCRVRNKKMLLLRGQSTERCRLYSDWVLDERFCARSSKGRREDAMFSAVGAVLRRPHGSAAGRFLLTRTSIFEPRRALPW
jgi:hypothetical protein